MSVGSEPLTARLVLEPAELAVLRACLPPGMLVGQRPAEAAGPGAVDGPVLAGLAARGVIDAGGGVNRSVLAGLVLLADPGAVRLSVVAAGPAQVRRTSIACSDALLAGLTVQEPGGRAEQFLARTQQVAGEVLRLLPALGVRPAPGRVGLSGQEPGLLLAAVQRAWASGGHGQELSGDAEAVSGAATTAALAEGFVGSFEVTLSLPAGSVADVPALDRLLWVATSGGWWSLRPHADRAGRARLDVVPVAPEDLAGELAPLMAAAALALGGLG